MAAFVSCELYILKSEGKHILVLPVVQPGSAEGGFTFEMDLVIRTSVGEVLSSLLQKRKWYSSFHSLVSKRESVYDLC